MKLSKNNKELLKKWGFTEEDIPQIERAITKTKYEYKDKFIKMSEAKELLGERVFLSGISRSAFHFTAVRETPNNELIYFDSSALFR